MLLTIFFIFEAFQGQCQQESPHDLHFKSLPARWDEGIPLGNGIMGALVWQRDSFVRISLDRSDLWDLRPIREFSIPAFSFQWVREQRAQNRYDTVQELFDLPYERDPGPTKIPAGALEIPVTGWGTVESAHLYLSVAEVVIRWNSGVVLRLYMDANQAIGRFRIENTGKNLLMMLRIPDFTSGSLAGSSSVDGQNLGRLNYPDPFIDTSTPGRLYYRQRGYGNFSYEVFVSWRMVEPGCFEGSWKITVIQDDTIQANRMTLADGLADTASYNAAFVSHQAWWQEFWHKSSVSLPDTVLENQWYRDIYKFGSASRPGAPPITLQAVWTADNGKLPPWKGDFHNDLNTQLSYWPGYSSNHLEESKVFCDWISGNLETARQYTRTYFKCRGVNFPGVSTLTGAPMGGWIQYALSPTISCWLARHYYLQWSYSMDTLFLEKDVYPFLQQCTEFIEDLAIQKGRDKQLPLSSSPEIHDNSADAWFDQTTNYDLALIRDLYRNVITCAEILGRTDDARKFKENLKAWPELSLSPDGSLMVAPGMSYVNSHRHFSHLMAIYPLCLLNRLTGDHDRSIIHNSIEDLVQVGPANWCGYSYAWLGNLYAQDGDGGKAAEALRTFSMCFCLPNSFHVNGDQSGTGKSSFTYRPFTLEGNFAFASGVQEMLLQSHQGIVVVFPAIPKNWKDVSFNRFRAEGAFLVSAIRKNGKTKTVSVFCEKGGVLRIKNPFSMKKIQMTGNSVVRFEKNGVLVLHTVPGQLVVMNSD